MERSTTAIMRFKPAPGLMVAEKVRLEKLLSRGGMGSVWIGRHVGLDLPVAVKFMSSSSVDLLARFQREARAAAQIRSSNVVKIHDFGVDRGTPYIVMELLEGEDLAGLLRRKGRLSLKEAEAILIPVARGLDRAHEARLVHRDLKPENIFLAKEGDEIVPKILDFGVAKSLAAEESAKEVTEEGAVLGTPYYMSPEQARARGDIDHRADLWSLGVILFRMITGVRPFQGQALGDVLLKICADPIPSATSIEPSLPPDLNPFFDRALARDREARFQSGRDLAKAFSTIAQAHEQQPVDPIAAARAFDGLFDASGARGPLTTTTQSGHAAPLSMSGASASISLAAPAAKKRNPLGIGIAIAALVALVGVILFSTMFRSAKPDSAPVQATKAPIPPADSPIPMPSATASEAAAPEPAPEPEPAAAPSSTTTTKSIKPTPSASAKKPNRDLGY